MDQWSKIIENLASRDHEKISKSLVHQNADVLFLMAANDWGVARNGGRIGARFAPENILSQFKKLSISDKNEQTWNFSEVCKSSMHGEFDDFQKFITQQTSNTLNNSNAKKIIHIGGGHDHIYPYLKSIDGKSKEIVVFNIDAHMDTRTDQLAHSGTPFRQFANETSATFKLVQIGIHDYANPQSNFDELAHSECTVLTYNQLIELTQNFTQQVEILSRFASFNKDVEYIFSLDCDAISAHEMPGVSALNHQGLPLSFVFDLLAQFQNLSSQRKHLGIYEFNPIFDTLSAQGARSLASLIYRFIYPS